MKKTDKGQKKGQNFAEIQKDEATNKVHKAPRNTSKTETANTKKEKIPSPLDCLPKVDATQREIERLKAEKEAINAKLSELNEATKANAESVARSAVEYATTHNYMAFVTFDEAKEQSDGFTFVLFESRETDAAKLSELLPFATIKENGRTFYAKRQAAETAADIVRSYESFNRYTKAKKNASRIKADKEESLEKAAAALAKRLGIDVQALLALRQK